MTETGDLVEAPGIPGGAILSVTTMGTIIDTIIRDGGRVIVGGANQTNANASATTVSSGGSLEVDAGGTTTGATVSSGGFEHVSAGGIAVGDTISGGGTEFVAAGGTTNGAMVLGTAGVVGAVQVVGWQQGNAVADAIAMSLLLPGVGPGTVDTPGGTANGTTVTLGIQTVAMGGVANNTVISGADQLVEIGGTANATMVNGASDEVVFSGGIANGTTLTGVNSNEIANLYLGTSLPAVTRGGITIGTVINQFATEVVSAGGVASNTRVNSGGSLLVGGGGMISGTTVLAGGQDLVGIAGAPNAVGTGTTLSGGIEVVEGPASNLPTGSALGTTVNGGDQIVFGSAVATTVNAPVAPATLSVETVWSGGISDSATINAGGFQFAVGSAVNDTLNGGTEFVFSNGFSSATTVNSGGVENVSAGSRAVATRINSGGNENVNSGGVDVDARVAGGETILAGGSATGTDILAGGTQVINAGGTSLNALIDGGLLVVRSGGSIGGPSAPVSFSSAGGTLQLDASRSFTGLIAGFASPAGITEAIDLRDITFAGAKATWTQVDNSSGTLTVANGSQTASLTLLGMYSTTQFKLASDGAAGGTLVTDPAVTASAPIAAPHT
jgi:autotransporter passenger strand-loop-strand repeat protein